MREIIVFQTLNNSIPVIFTDIPKSTAPHAREYMLEELQRLVTHLEKLTGNKITDEGLREKIILANNIRANYRKVLYYLKTPEKMPLSPYAYMQLIALLNISFIDFLSAIKYFNKQFLKLIKDLDSRRKIDYEGVPKIMLVPVFSGSEPDLPQIMNELGGCLIQADNLAYGMLDPIKTEGDMIHNYCDYLVNMHECWSANKILVKSWLDLANELRVDGIIFNKLIGCTSITPSYRLFKDRVRDTGIPFIDVDFNRIGENLAQIKNKLTSFMEVVKKEI